MCIDYQFEYILNYKHIYFAQNSKLSLMGITAELNFGKSSMMGYKLVLAGRKLHTT